MRLSGIDDIVRASENLWEIYAAGYWSNQWLTLTYSPDDGGYYCHKWEPEEISTAIYQTPQQAVDAAKAGNWDI